jgi:DNA-directed RNA polymerase specialized sigma24 family protein
MANPTELDLFNRSLGGDRRARTELYKKFVHGSTRVSRLGVGYSSPTDFLHDCFSNLLRTGHSWDTEESLAKWVESVAVWTALANERQRDMHVRGARGEIRMCAEIEGEDAVHGEVLSAYAPPFWGAEDSPSARILGLLTDTEQAVFRKRAMENGTWEETAAAAGKPLNGVGQIFARVVSRVVRLFGAPPPLDDDLAPVVSRVFANPLKPEGRAVAMQLDTGFYELTPEMHSIGLKTTYEARIAVLWDAAQQPTPPADELRRHLDGCHYCADLLRALLLMQQALLSPPGVEFRLCPGAFTLANAPDLVREAFDQHLAQCSICRTERTQALDGHVPRQDGSPALREAAGGAGKKLAWTLAGLLLLGVASVAGYYYFAPHKQALAGASILSDKPHPTVAMDPRYRDLVENVTLDDARIMASVLPANRAAMRFVLDQFSLGEMGQALMVSAQVAEKSHDPGAQMVYAMTLFRTRLMTDAYREMLKSEAMAPRDSLRCWVMLQFALAVGDRGVLEREAQHLSDNPDYKDKVKRILASVKARGTRAPGDHSVGHSSRRTAAAFRVGHAERVSVEARKRLHSDRRGDGYGGVLQDARFGPRRPGFRVGPDGGDCHQPLSPRPHRSGAAVGRSVGSEAAHLAG